MNAVIQKITAEPAGSPQEMAMRIKREMPTLADLAPNQLEAIAKMVIAQRLTAEMNTAVDLAGIDWKEQRGTFLGDTKSPHTRRAYNAALQRLERWGNLNGLNQQALLAISTTQADQFIRFLKEEDRAPVSIRRDIAAVSAFYTFMERNTEGKVKNSFRGTRIRPQNENKKDIVIPTEEEYQIIITSIPAKERAILAALALRGLRAGALPTLVLKDGKYHGKSKGKTLQENGTDGITFPSAVLDAMKAANLDMKKPFAWKTRQKTTMNAGAIESRINKHLKKLHQEGKIKAAFSCHDLRHFFAKNEYEKTKDIHRISVLLGHSNVAITQTYLKSLKVKL